ncbi:MAG: TetR family transcriptional regulator [Novosphingobium sp.]
MMTAEPQAKLRPSTEETRIRIIEAAERLFGEQGIEAVSLRTISATARQRNNFSVQYHFGDRLGLLRAIFEYREAELDAIREKLVTEGRKRGQLGDMRFLLRVCFYPEFRHFMQNNGLPYIRLHFQYLANLRPRGVLHPIDYDSPSSTYLRETIHCMRQKLHFLNEQQFAMRLEAVSSMFLGAIMQHAARPQEPALHAAVHYPSLFETLLEMMAVAITVPPWDFSGED